MKFLVSLALVALAAFFAFERPVHSQPQGGFADPLADRVKLLEEGQRLHADRLGELESALAKLPFRDPLQQAPAQWPAAGVPVSVPVVTSAGKLTRLSDGTYVSCDANGCKVITASGGYFQPQQVSVSCPDGNCNYGASFYSGGGGCSTCVSSPRRGIFGFFRRR